MRRQPTVWTRLIERPLMTQSLGISRLQSIEAFEVYLGRCVQVVVGTELAAMCRIVLKNERHAATIETQDVVDTSSKPSPARNGNAPGINFHS